MKLGQFDELSREVERAMDDYGNLLYTSSVCVHEMIHLCQIGNVSKKLGHKKVNIDASEIVPWLHEMGIEVCPITERHLAAMAKLPLRKDHHDPFDRLIIAQAVTDGIDIISSDRQFANYRKHGLKLMFNER